MSRHASPGAPRVGRAAARSAWAALAMLLPLHAAWAQPYTAPGVSPLEQGRELVVSGRPGEAVPLLRQAVQVSPQDPAAHYALAEAYFRNGELENALRSLRAAAARSQDPAFRQNADSKAAAIEGMLAEQGVAPRPYAEAEPPPPRQPAMQHAPSGTAGPVDRATQPLTDFDAADAALAANDIDKAHIHVLTGLRAEPSSGRGNGLLGDILARKNDLGGARDAYTQALGGTDLTPGEQQEIERKLLRIEIDLEPGLADAPSRPSRPQATAARAPSQLGTPDPAPAAAAPEDDAYRSPVNAATTLAAAGNLEGAIETLRAYLASSPSDTKARAALARYLHDAGDDAGALDEVRLVLAAESGNDNARNLRISILMARGDFAGALADLDALAVSGRATATTYVNRGVANQRLGNLDLALQDYDQAIAMDAGNIGYYVNKAAVLVEKRNERAAIDVLTAAIARGGPSVNAVLYRGMAYFNIGQYDAAITDFGQTLALAPDNRQALLYRAQAHKLNNAPSLALADLDRLIALAPSDAEALTLRGTYRAAMGLHRDAIADYDRVLALQPGNRDVIARRSLAAAELAKAAPGPGPM